MAQKLTKEQIVSHLTDQFGLSLEQINAMLPSFITTLGSHLHNLESALIEEDLILLGRMGHTIKGAFLNLGLEECAAIALQIEKKGKEGDISTNYRQLVEDLRLRVNPLLD